MRASPLLFSSWHARDLCASRRGRRYVPPPGFEEDDDEEDDDGSTKKIRSAWGNKSRSKDDSAPKRPMSACAALRSRPSQTERSRHPSRAVRAASYRASSYSVSARLCIDHVEKARRSGSSAAKSVASTVDGGRRLDMRARKHHWTRARVACSTDLPASTCAAISTCL